jgi:hypothetical protein
MLRKRAFPVVVAAVAALAAVAQAPAPSMAADHNDPIGVQAAYRSGDSANGYTVATGDPSADIADIFAWYTGAKGSPQSVVLALTWRVDPIAEKEHAFDPSVKYAIHIDTTDHGLLDVSVDPADGLSLSTKLVTHATSDIVVWFGEHKQNKGQWGMLVTGLPGVDHEVVGPVGKVLEPAPGVKVVSGLFDDPFFADLDAFFNAISVALGNKPGNPSLPLDRFHKVDPTTQRLTRPFGYPVGVDGFSRQNMHAVVVELPASAFPTRKIKVWGTTDRKKGLAKSGEDLRCRYDSANGAYHCGGGQ